MSKQKVQADSKRKSQLFMRLSINSEAIEKNFQIQVSKQKLQNIYHENVKKESAFFGVEESHVYEKEKIEPNDQAEDWEPPTVGKIGTNELLE
jgi:hypothetical protein